MKYLMVAVVIAFSTISSESAAQVTSSGAQQAPDASEPTDGLRTRNAMSQAELKRLGEMIEQWNRVDGKSGMSPREARSRTGQMLKVLEVSCAITDAAYRGIAPGEPESHIYEAACEDGMGYLMSLAGESLSGTSCLSGDELASQVRCALPANVDNETIAAAVLRGKAVACSVLDVKWLGIDSGNRDHVEVACEEAAGYVLRAPRPGHRGRLEVLDCVAAGKAGVRCQMTTPASAPSAATDSRPTLSWFKDALGRNGVTCRTKRARIVGRESIKRRYLVEFECEDQPQGLIAFVPPEGDTVNAFESMNCVTAANRGIHCQFLSAGP